MRKRDLLTFAADLLAANSGAAVVAQLDQLRQPDEALYLVDSGAATVYPVCGDGQEIALQAVPSSGWHPLHSSDEHLGYWVSQAEDAPQMATLLAPLLLRLREHEAASGDLRRARRELREIITAGQLLRHLDIEVLLVQALETMLGSLDAEVGAILTPEERDVTDDSDDGSGALLVRTTWGLQPQHVDQICLRDGQRAVDMCHVEGCHLRLSAEELGKVIATEQLQVGLRSLLILPLVSPGRRHGVLLLANPQHPFDAEAQRLAETLCDMVIIALENARLVAATLAKERLARDMHLARTVQADMLPKADLQVGSLLVAGRSEPCDETGGDYFSYQRSENDLVQCCIGDVTGHGLGAALFTTIAHAIAQQGFRRELAPDAAIIQLNESLYATGSGRFMTGVVLEIDPTTGALRYCSAGHNPLLHLHGDEQRWLNSQTLPLGICEDLTTLGLNGVAETTIAPGDWLVLYTDGFIEAADASEELWGEQRMAAIIQAARAEACTPAEAIDRVVAGVYDYAGRVPIDDDLTIVIIARAAV